MAGPSYTVCRTCFDRKKACDKALPACGFCTKKNIKCQYGRPMKQRKYYPGRAFVAVADLTSLGPVRRDEQNCATTGLLFDYLIQSAPQSIDGIIYNRVRNVLAAANITPDDVGKSYFQIFDHSLPITSPASFRQMASEFGKTANPPAHSSVLMLTTLLVIGHPHANNYDRALVYRTCKALISQLQAVTDVSLQLLQATFLIAATEYISGRPETAYVTLMSCAAIARVLPISKTDLIQMPDVCWAVATLERLILCELPGRGLLPLTEVPKTSCLISWNVPDSSIRDQMQLLSLLEQTLCLKRSAGNGEATGQADIMSLDANIRSCLERVMSNYLDKQDTTSTSVALAVRLMFLLHGAVLDSDEIISAKMEDVDRLRSVKSLDSVCNMVVDIARFHNPNKGEMMPMCCYYNLRAAIQHLQKHETNRLETPPDVNCLLESEKRYREKWFLIPPHS